MSISIAPDAVDIRLHRRELNQRIDIALDNRDAEEVYRFVSELMAYEGEEAETE